MMQPDGAIPQGDPAGGVGIGVPEQGAPGYSTGGRF